MSTPKDSAAASFLSSASNVKIRDSTMIAIANANVDMSAPRADGYNYLRYLDVEVSTNAILNNGGRADAVRCYPGTREEVISKIETWIKTGYKADRNILWLSGPAGAGKSAIMQTIAENCLQRKVPMANFFFFRADSTRNDSHALVATLLYQLLKLYPDLKPIINNIIAQDRLIFRASIRDQFATLIEQPIHSIRRGTPGALPIVFLVDGLDECDPRPELDTAAKSEQTAILHVLHHLVAPSNSPFIAVVASRVESHIEMGFNRVGHATGSAYLNEDYRPDDDIRFYLTAELSNIKLTHPLGRRLEASWPPPSVIAALVQKSSGQFIYAATAMRFIANSPQSPAFTMQMVLGARPVQKHSPFAEIDAIYSFILSRAEHWDIVRDMLALQTLARQNSIDGVPISALGHSADEVESFFSDLVSIIRVSLLDNGRLEPHFYHASFEDFVYSKERAGAFHIELSTTLNRLTPSLLLQVSNRDTFTFAILFLRRITRKTEPLTVALKRGPVSQPRCTANFLRIMEEQFYPKVRQLYGRHDEDLYDEICETWHGVFHPEKSLRYKYASPEHNGEAKSEIPNRSRNRSKSLRRLFLCW